MGASPEAKARHALRRDHRVQIATFVHDTDSERPASGGGRSRPIGRDSQAIDV